MSTKPLPLVEAPLEVLTNYPGTMIIIRVDTMELWLNRDEALTLAELLPGAINKMPVQID
mgnify:CR=1 FL=1